MAPCVPAVPRALGLDRWGRQEGSCPRSAKIPLIWVGAEKRSWNLLFPPLALGLRTLLLPLSDARILALFSSKQTVSPTAPFTCFLPLALPPRGQGTELGEVWGEKGQPPCRPSAITQALMALLLFPLARSACLRSRLGGSAPDGTRGGPPV